MERKNCQENGADGELRRAAESELKVIRDLGIAREEGTQCRRIIKPRPYFEPEHGQVDRDDGIIHVRYGGTRLVVAKRNHRIALYNH